MPHYLHHLRHTATTLAWPAAITVGLGLAGSTMAVAPALASTGGSGQPGYVVQQILSGKQLHHSYTVAGSATAHTEPLADPDDLTSLGPDLFTGFQNGVGPQGQAATDGNTASTIVEFTADGQPVRQWDIVGKCDGVTADPITGQLIATVNEDAHSSVYTIAPWAPAGHQVRHYQYNEPLPSKGGTDAISIYHGMVLISASAPGTTGAAAPQPGYPAVYQVTFDPASLVATVHPLFYDESTATVANNGSGHPQVKLALTDPDSNEVVPWSAPRFAGDFMLTSQGDKEQIYVQQAGAAGAAAARAEAGPVGRRHRLGHQPLRAAVRRGHLGRHHRLGDRLVYPRNGVRGGHPVRRQRRARHLPRARVPGELPRHAQPIDRADHRGAAARPGAGAAGAAVRRVMTGRPVMTRSPGHDRPMASW